MTQKSSNAVTEIHKVFPSVHLMVQVTMPRHLCYKICQGSTILMKKHSYL